MADKILLRQIGGPDILFTGDLLASVQSSDLRVADGEEWCKIAVMRLETSWVVIGQRSIDGPLGAAFVGSYFGVDDLSIPARDSPSQFILPRRTLSANEAEEHLIGSTMQWLNWSLLAKELAAKLSWNIGEERN